MRKEGVEQFNNIVKITQNSFDKVISLIEGAWKNNKNETVSHTIKEVVKKFSIKTAKEKKVFCAGYILGRIMEQNDNNAMIAMQRQLMGQNIKPPSGKEFGDRPRPLNN